MKADPLELPTARTGFSKTMARVVINTLLGALAEAIKREEKVELWSFGSFCPRLLQTRTARNRRTGARVEVARRRGLAFRSGKELWEAVNGE